MSRKTFPAQRSERHFKDMARFYPLFSSSKGNSVYIGGRESGILIDAGVSCSRLTAALAANDIPMSAVKALFITHNHSDHINGVKNLTKKYPISVFAEAGTLDYLFENGCIYTDGQDMKGVVTAAGMEISCFHTPHDAPESCGYRIKTSDGRICCVCTDLGYVTETVLENLTGSDLVYIESNYDENMLKMGSYPAYLKARIRSKHGHLSNSDCGQLAAHLVKNGTTRLILGHLSQENNRPETADAAVCGALSAAGFQRNIDYILSVAKPESEGGFVAF